MRGGLFGDESEESLSGTVTREIFRNTQGTFAVVRITTEEGYATTLTGALPPVQPGERVEAKGEWVEDARHGRQFKAHTCYHRPPDSVEAIERYLGSGAIEGVGPELASRLVETFGTETLAALGEGAERLQEVKGIGAVKAERIAESWAAQHASRDVMLFLRGHGIGPVLAQRAFLRFGADTRQTLEGDPFLLAREVEGAGFLTADRLALALGFARDDPRRLRAGLLHVAEEALSQGSTALPVGDLLQQAADALGAAPEQLEPALFTAREDLALELDRPTGAEVVYLPQLLRAERGAARLTALLVAGGVPRRLPPCDPVQALAGLSGGELELSPAQREALEAALTSALTVITGGPGVGKTTVVRTLVQLLQARGVTFNLAAPTGRAAKRLEEATGASASTLHRLLEWEPSGGFTRNADNTLEVDLVVVDEASMVDLRLYYALLRALPVGCSLVLIGDVDQLPSVGAGNVLADLIQSGAARVVRLREVFRQSAASRIVTAAHAINEGVIPDLTRDADGTTDFFFVEQTTPEATRNMVVRLVTERIPAAFGLDPLEDVMVLAPMHRGTCGTEELNRALKAAIQGTEPAPHEEGRRFVELSAGDKVMQLRNDYEHEVFNGEVGRVVEAAPEGGEVVVDFSGKRVLVSRGERSRLALAYCATIHKAQGSEYPAVVLPLLTEHFVMLQRNLLYTGLTRARKLAVIVGQRRALELAIQNDRPRHRLSFLAERIQAALA